MKMFKCVAAMCVAVVAVSAQAGASLIDSFDLSPQFVVSGVAGFSTNNAATLQALGGFRQLEAFGAFGNLTGTAGVFNGNLVFGNGPAGIGTLVVSYTSNNVGLGGGAGTNLFAGNASAFEIDVVADDTIPTVLNYKVEDVFGGVSTAFANIGGSAAGSTFVVPFLNFVGNADFSMAKFFRMTLVGGANADITLDNLRTNTSPVPEPSSMALAFSGLAIGAVAYRRRNRQPKLIA